MRKSFFIFARIAGARGSDGIRTKILHAKTFGQIGTCVLRTWTFDVDVVWLR